MIPGPTIIRKCSECSQYIEQFTLMSGNTIGAKIWTDGWRDAPMMPDQPLLVECPHCYAHLWIDELEQIGEIAQEGKSDEFKGSKPYNTPGFQKYIKILTDKIPDLEKERYLRLRAWWAGNDARRETIQKIPLSDEEILNLQATLELLNEDDPNARLMKAEIMRELGRFDEASKLLNHRFDNEYSQAVEIIRNLIEQKSQFVAEMRFD